MLKKPEWDYDPAWIEWNNAHPGPRSVGAAAADGDGGDGGDGEGEGEGQGGGGQGGGSGGDAGGDGGGGPGKGAAAGSKGGASGVDRTGSMFSGSGQDGGGGEPDPAHKAAHDDPDRPENIPAKFWDPEAKAVRTDDLLKSYQKLEAAHGKLRGSKGIGGDVPESPEGYIGEGDWETPDLDRVREIAPDDPALQGWAKIAHKYGIGKEAMLGIAKEFLAEINPGLPEPVNPEHEKEKLGEGADRLLAGIETWFTGLYEGGQISDDEYAYMIAMGSTATGVTLLSKMRELSGEKPLPYIRGEVGAEEMSEAQWHEAMRAAVKAKDYAEQERLEKVGESIFGTAPAGTSNSRFRPGAPAVDSRSYQK